MTGDLTAVERLQREAGIAWARLFAGKRMAYVFVYQQTLCPLQVRANLYLSNSRSRHDVFWGPVTSRPPPNSFMLTWQASASELLPRLYDLERQLLGSFYGDDEEGEENEQNERDLAEAQRLLKRIQDLLPLCDPRSEGGYVLLLHVLPHDGAFWNEVRKTTIATMISYTPFHFSLSSSLLAQSEAMPSM